MSNSEELSFSCTFSGYYPLICDALLPCSIVGHARCQRIFPLILYSISFLDSLKTIHRTHILVTVMLCILPPLYRRLQAIAYLYILDITNNSQTEIGMPNGNSQY